MKSLHLCALPLCLAPFAGADNHDLPFNNTLRDKVLVLRGAYRSEKLRFSAAGALIGPGEKSLGFTDATFHVRRIEPVSQAVFSYGDLPVMYYDAATGNVSFKPGAIEREVSIEVDSTDQLAVERALWQVFYRPDEPLPITCTPDEKSFFQSLSTPGRVEHPRDEYPATGLCLPYGERILYKPIVSATTPRAQSTPDASFPADAPRKRHIDGSVVVGFIVDAAGHVSSVFVLKGMQEPFDRAAAATVHTWEFRPALHEGQPVPAYLKAEVSFRRY